MRLKPVYATDPNLVDAPLTRSPKSMGAATRYSSLPLSTVSRFPKVRQGLEELGVQWQSHPILLSAHQQFSPSYVRINSRCVVPTLVIDGTVTTDTINILDLLAARFGAANQCFETSEAEREPVNYWVDKAAGLFIEALTYGHVEGEETLSTGE